MRRCTMRQTRLRKAALVASRSCRAYFISVPKVRGRAIITCWDSYKLTVVLNDRTAYDNPKQIKQ